MVFEAPGPKGVRALGPPGLHTTAREPKRAHLRVPALQTPPKFHEKTPREKKKDTKRPPEREKKRAKMEQGEGKKARNVGWSGGGGSSGGVPAAGGGGSCGEGSCGGVPASFPKWAPPVFSCRPGLKPSLADCAQQLFDKREEPTYRLQVVNGPLHSLREVLHQLGASLDRHFSIYHPRVLKFSLLTQEKAYVQQATREMIAHAQWKQISTRCAPLATAKNTPQDMKGIPGHLDVITTTWLLRHRGVKHDPLLRHFHSDVQTRDLGLIVSGAVAHSQIPDSRGEVITNGWCRHCNNPEAIEDSHHLFRQCYREGARCHI